MRKILKTVLIIAMFAFLAYNQRLLIRDQFVPVFNDTVARVFHTSPCNNPVVYNIGDFDTKFGISEKYFLDALSEAEAIWEKPYGKNLFEYRPDNTSVNRVRVNLVYDYRQQATTKLKDVGSTLSDTRSSYDTLKEDFNTKKSAYEDSLKDLNRAIISFEAKNEAYKKEVEYWNARGGAPDAEYKQLKAERSELESESNRIKTMQDEVNREVAEINALVGELNSIASDLNLTVEKYNTIGASRGESFEEGLYKSDGVNKEIDIYEFSNKDKLVRVLAHELGHALGLDHVSDTQGIMYEFNQGKALTATAGDLAALSVLCQDKQN